MKHVAIAFFLCLLAPVALAQSVLPPCVPLVRGYPVGLPKLVEGEVGLHVFQYCSDSKGSPAQPYGLSCLFSHCSVSSVGRAMTQITTASAKVGTARELWASGVTFDCTAAVRAEQTERGALCRERLEVLKLYQAEWGAK